MGETKGLCFDWHRRWNDNGNRTWGLGVGGVWYISILFVFVMLNKEL
jgi:hypothetical protein